jgi:hypothetical protein
MLKQGDLDQFIGTEEYHKYMAGVVLTDGVKYLAEEGKCFWLIDIVCSYQHTHSKVPFQLWEMEVKDDKSAVVTMREDTGKKALVMQRIGYTDFPLKSIKLYLIDGVLLLPSEY